MRLLLYEHLTALAGSGLDLPSSLAAEGGAMLRGLIEDCRPLPGIEPHTLVGQFLNADLQAIVHRVDPSKGWLNCFSEQLELVDAVLIVAPEFDRILEILTNQVERSHTLLLGCSSQAIALTADKWTCGRVWEAQRIPTPPSVLVHAGHLPFPPPYLTFPLVLKLRDGAGSLATVLIPDAASWPQAVSAVSAERPGGQWIAQPSIAGHAASVSCIVHESGVVALPAATQHLSDDGRFHYRGGELPLAPNLTTRAQNLASRAVSAIRGLRGYVGVDLVLGSDELGGDDSVIEINPRITTSYLGLRALCRQNLLGVILAACQRQPIPPLSWNDGSVQFHADGSVFVRGQESAATVSRELL